MILLTVFAALLLYELMSRETRRGAIRDGLVFSVGLLVTFTVLFLVHRETLAVPDPIMAGTTPIIIPRRPQRTCEVDNILQINSQREPGAGWGRRASTVELCGAAAST